MLISAPCSEAQTPSISKSTVETQHNNKYCAGCSTRILKSCLYPHGSSSGSTEGVSQASPQAGKGPWLSPKTPGIYTKLLLQCVFPSGIAGFCSQESSSPWAEPWGTPDPQWVPAESFQGAKMCFLHQDIQSQLFKQIIHYKNDFCSRCIQSS